MDKIESVQRRAARFITGDYKTREEGTVTNMLADLQLIPLAERRKQQRLAMFYRVVEGLVPAIAPEDYLFEIRNKRNIKATKFQDYQHKNIIERLEVNNTRGYKTIQCNTDCRKHSYFPRTIIDWNHLEDSVVHAKSAEGFVTALQQCY